MIKSFFAKNNVLLDCIALLLAALLFLLIFAIQNELSQQPLVSAVQSKTSHTDTQHLSKNDALPKNQPKRAVQTIAYNDQSFSVGPQNAQVVVVEFLDFQCPYCKQSVPVVKKLMQDYEHSSVLFVFRHFPIITTHPFALQAALGAECARDQGKFFEMHDSFYEKQDTFSQATPSLIAQELNLNLAQFNTCLAEKKYQTRIAKDVSDAFDLSITGTPLFIVNNIQLSGAANYDELKNTIDKELQGK